jgi:hypothetical protein
VAAENKSDRIPVICADDATVAGAELFDPNDWTDKSKGIVYSCWSEFAVLHHSVGQIVDTCGKAEQLCGLQVKSIQAQWQAAPFDLEKVVILAPQPLLHMQIEAFLSGVKTLLDLIVQLLSAEKIVAGVVDGFHRAQNEYGGKVLNQLRRNATAAAKGKAEKVSGLIREHKATWIDQTIFARDQLIHPGRGMHQLMFQLAFAEKQGKLALDKILPPCVGAAPIQEFAPKVLASAEQFSKDFLSFVRA